MKKILVAYDATEGAFRALQSTIELAKVFSSEVGVVSVVPMHPGRAPVDPWDDRPVHTEQLHQAREILVEAGIEPSLHEPIGDPATAIERLAGESGYDTIVTGCAWFESPIRLEVFEESTLSALLHGDDPSEGTLDQPLVVDLPRHPEADDPAHTRTAVVRKRRARSHLRTSSRRCAWCPAHQRRPAVKGSLHGDGLDSAEGPSRAGRSAPTPTRGTHRDHGQAKRTARDGHLALAPAQPIATLGL